MPRQPARARWSGLIARLAIAAPLTRVQAQAQAQAAAPPTSCVAGAGEAAAAAQRLETEAAPDQGETLFDDVARQRVYLVRDAHRGGWLADPQRHAVVRMLARAACRAVP